MHTEFVVFENEILFLNDGDSFHGRKFIDCIIVVPQHLKVTFDSCQWVISR